MSAENEPKSSPRKTAERVAREHFRSGDDATSLRRDVRGWLQAAFWSAVTVPVLFYLRFVEVGPLGWGLTVFFCVYCLLSAVGLHFLAKPEYHTPIASRGNWLDKVGMFWLVVCALGPFLGWLITNFDMSLGNWRWFYGVRVVLCIVLPVLSALPLLRYVRGRGAPLMLAILLGVTALPVWSGWAYLRDLQVGPKEQDSHANPPLRQWVLPHTSQVVQEAVLR